MNRLTAFIIFCVFSILQSSAQTNDNADRAFQQADESGRYVLLVFSGSDWCAPCIRLEKKIFSTTLFQDFATSELIMLVADFPQRKRMAKELQQQNEALAERYNPNGLFPYVLLLRSDRSVVSEVPYNNETVQTFIATLRQYINHDKSLRVQKTN